MIKALLNNRFFSISIVLLLTLIAHGNIFQNEFVMDDFDFIVNWPLIQEWKNFPQFFIGYIPPPGEEGIYSPLKTVFHAVNYQLFGLNPLGYHIVSLLIHFTGIYFVYKISFILTANARAAFLTGLFFALHPVQVEAITYMTASVDMIGIVFLFAGFFWYIKTIDAEGRFIRRAYICSLIFALLSIFTHELAISIPLLFLWYEMTLRKHRGTWKETALRISPYFIITGSYALSKFLVLKVITRGAYLYDSFTLTMLVSIKAWAKYVYLCLLPSVLTHNQMISKGISSFDPDDFDSTAVLMQSFFDTQVLIAMLVLGGIVYVSVRNFKTQPLIAFCAGWFFIALLPVSNIIPSGVFFGERYLYPGLLGFCIILGLIIDRICNREGTLLRIRFLTLGVILAVSIVSFYSVRTWTRNKDWKNEISLYESAVWANPQSALMRTDLGIVYLKNQDLDKAMNSFQEALEIRPDDPVTYFARSEAYIQMDQRQKAKDSLYKAIELNADYAEAYYNLAGIYAVSGEMDRAREYLGKSDYYYRDQGRVQEADELQRVFKEYFNLK